MAAARGVCRDWTASPRWSSKPERWRAYWRDGPFLAAQFFGGPHSFLEGRLHEFGTTLLTLAGLFNLLAVSNALELRKAERS